MALPPLFSLKKSCESPANPRNNQKPHILHEIGWIPMSSLVHCGIAGLRLVGLPGPAGDGTMGRFMSSGSHYRPRVGVPYRTRNEELADNDAELRKYLEAVGAAGGDPVEVSLALASEEIKELARTLDAVVLTGSPADVEPSLFHAARHPKSADPDRDRERIDFALLDYCLAEHKPVLAICYGIQTLNVFLGGTLIQDIASELHTQILHDLEHDHGAPEAFHATCFEPGSRLAEMAGAVQLQVNSSHHPSILKPG